MPRIRHDRRWQGVEREEVRDGMSFRILGYGGLTAGDGQRNAVVELASTTYVHTTCPGRRPVEVAFSPFPRPLRNWCRTSSSSSSGTISKRSMYLLYSPATADTSFSSISLRPERESARVDGALYFRIMRAMVMSRGTYVNFASTSFGTLSVRW